MNTSRQLSEEITVNVNWFVLVGDKCFESRGKLIIRFANAHIANGFFELLRADLSILISSYCMYRSTFSAF